MSRDYCNILLHVPLFKLLKYIKLRKNNLFYKQFNFSVPFCSPLLQTVWWTQRMALLRREQLLLQINLLKSVLVSQNSPMCLSRTQQHEVLKIYAFLLYSFYSIFSVILTIFKDGKQILEVGVDRQCMISLRTNFHYYGWL